MNSRRLIVKPIIQRFTTVNGIGYSYAVVINGMPKFQTFKREEYEVYLANLMLRDE